MREQSLNVSGPKKSKSNDGEIEFWQIRQAKEISKNSWERILTASTIERQQNEIKKINTGLRWGCSFGDVWDGRGDLSIRGCVGGYSGNREKIQRGSVFALLLMYSDLKLNFHQMCFLSLTQRGLLTSLECN